MPDTAVLASPVGCAGRVLMLNEVDVLPPVFVAVTRSVFALPGDKLFNTIVDAVKGTLAPPFKVYDQEVLTPLVLTPPDTSTVQPVVVIGPKAEILSTGAVGGFGRVLKVPPVKGMPEREFNVVVAEPILVSHAFVASTCAPYEL